MAMKGYSTFPKAGTSPSNCLVSYPEHSSEGSHPSAEKQSVYSTQIVWSSILLGESRQSLIFRRSESSSSWVNCPRLMSNFFPIILVIGTCVTFGGFPSRFSKCYFHSFILSCWFAAFNFALAVLFLLLTSFIVFQAILDCLSSTESLILYIWFCMYSVCSFRYMPANWYCAFLVFGHLCLLGSPNSFWR